jgi:hypothetical protein
MIMSRVVLLAAFALALGYSGAARAEAQNITKAVQSGNTINSATSTASAPSS